MAQTQKQLKWEWQGLKQIIWTRTEDRNIGAVKDSTHWYWAHFGNHTLSRKESM